MAEMELKQRIKDVLDGAFHGPEEHVLMHDGHGGNVWVWVVSPSFDGVPDYVRQDRVWAALERVEQRDLVRVSLILCFTPDEPEYQWALREVTEAAS